MPEARCLCGVFFKFRGWAVFSPGLLFLAAGVVRSCGHSGDGHKHGVLCAVALIGVIIEKAKNLRDVTN